MKNILLVVIIFLSLPFARRDCLKQAETDALGRSIIPVNQDSAISPSGYFFIHYDTTGEAAPDLTDNNPNNGIPDYVDEVGIIADSARNVLINEMTYQQEPLDNDGIYDIYLSKLGDREYGWANPTNGGRSYLKIRNEYDIFSTSSLSSLQLMRITLAHEYFHAIQYGYRKYSVSSSFTSNKYFYEMSSMWFEDILIPDGNDI